MTKAAYWYGKAAAQGFVLAMINLGNLHREGRSMDQDDAKAEDWYEKAFQASSEGSQEKAHVEGLLKELRE